MTADDGADRGRQSKGEWPQMEATANGQALRRDPLWAACGGGRRRRETPARGKPGAASLVAAECESEPGGKGRPCVWL